MKSYRRWAPDQSFLLPPSPRDWLPEGHLAYFVLDLVAELDLSAITNVIQAKDGRGERPYAPQMMLALLVYGYCVGVYSSRRIERATFEDVAFRVIAGGGHPHFTRINAFRRDHLKALKGLFLQILKLCQRAGLVKLGHVALDGTKVQANASKHKAMSYERMEKTERRLTAEIDALLERAQKLDDEEDDRFGVGHCEEDIPAELHRREKRLEKIRAAKAALEQEAVRSRIRKLEELAAGNDTAASKLPDPSQRKYAKTRAARQRAEAQELSTQLDNDDDDSPSGGARTSDGLETHRVPATPQGKPKPKAQRNFTDGDSRIMESNSAFLQGYNCQLAVDEESQVIVGESVTNQVADNRHLMPMLEQVAKNCGETPGNLTADAGYWRSTHEEECRRLGVEAYIAQQKRPRRDGPVKALEPARQSMKDKLASDTGKRVYARRKAVVEPVNGQIKEARGFRRFHLRGLEKVVAEWSLVSACHNLLKLFGAGYALQPP